MKPRVFISHTDAEDLDSRDFREALRSRLEASGFDPFLDERENKVGDEWRRTVLLELLNSHAGVILLTPKAITGEGTDWMRFETNVLGMLRAQSQRASRQATATFPIFPVRVPPVSAEDVKHSWVEPQGLDELLSAATSPALIERIVARLEDTGLKEAHADTPLKKLQDVIVPWLKEVDHERLCEAGRALGEDKGTTETDTGTIEGIAKE